MKFKIKLISLCLLLLTFALSNLLAQSGLTIVRLYDKTSLMLNPKAAGVNDDNFGIEIDIMGSGRLSIFNNLNEKVLNFKTGDKREKIYLYKSLIGFNPSKIEVESDSSFDLLSAKIFQINNEQRLSADVGHIIFSTYNEEEDFIIYKWNINPDILIFDTKNYEIQAKIFKRLAFFVEKTGFVGTILSDEDLENKHGWNAHDYKPDDIAAFFNESEKINFTLNQEELKLREILLKERVIIKDDNLYKEGLGAVISVSRQSSQNWRFRFLTHECLHGLFFTNGAFKKDIFDEFRSLNPEEINFWKHLLDYRNYDVSNEYLLVNEFMAYILQQPIEEVNDYFKGFLYNKMIDARPYEKEFLRIFDDKYPDSFVIAAKGLEDILYDYTGFKAGNLANICPDSIKDSFFDLFP